MPTYIVGDTSPPKGLEAFIDQGSCAKLLVHDQTG